MFKYFDLNFRARPEEDHPGADLQERRGFQRLDKKKEEKKAGGQEKIAEAVPPAAGAAAPAHLPVGKQLVIYLSVVVGVLFSSAVDQFKRGETPALDVRVGVVAVVAVVGLVIFPQAYEKLRLSSTLPLLVQVGLSLQNGIFWHVLFTAIGKAIAPEK